MDGAFEYIIVGAGSAGSVLAERLATAGKRVLVLEAGGSDRRFFVQMPLGYGKTFYDPKVNWGYRTEPDAGLNGQSDYWPRGKILGGSSSINAMVWVRGHAGDYADWQRATGRSDWGWEAVLRAYRQIEDCADGGDHWRGQGGPLHIRSNKAHAHPLVAPFLQACESAGLPRTPDFNGAQQEGAGIYQLTIKGGRRNSAARAFLRPALATGRVALRTGAQVTRVLIEGRRAIGVEYLWKGKLLRALGGEVILAGGAINTPQLLMLSGIGPAQMLRDQGIEVRLDQPNVGAHLNDHQGINYTYRMTVPTLNQILRPWWGKARVGLQYLLTGGGPLGVSINHAGGFFKTDPALERPNMQLYFQAFSTLIPRGETRPVLTPDPFPGLSIGLSNCRPSSRGSVELASADPLAPPRIHGNVFSTPQDVSEMLAAVKMLRRIAEQAPLKTLIAEELRPGPQVAGDDALVEDFRQRSGTVFHPSCTARMGRDPASSVVDGDLRVHGIDGLRVCDAAAFPTLIGGNTNAPAILIGWLGAQRILATAPSAG
ncbi:GMC family oxidoreductase [Pararhodobacter oceanensis]|uniref:Choline dehydrogenase n=1 Tax=Pararhodobacter oceanensis TaxID=2172121 RepID=A0A2T8HQF5_9RHOB|nr:GMC family oxidoreductase N-terminal domain-containing protein [Pararhodobacter oceanensis]PVH27656.1 choline dehydrogenase [Pararhodobacter oceanensis]